MLDLCDSHLEVQTFGSAPGNNQRAIPRPGRPLGTLVERLGVPVQKAVRSIFSDINVSGADVTWIFSGTPLGPGAKAEKDSLRASWLIVAIALAHAYRFNSSSVTDALKWFFSEDEHLLIRFSFLSERSHCAISKAVSGFDSQEEIYSYLPYVLEPHGHVTRGRLERTAAGVATRATKRSSGVFYTPSDVAEFLVGELATCLQGHETWCDPACGTGIFLRFALLKSCEANGRRPDAFEIASNQIFGMDISAVALDMTALVLLVECLIEVSVSPVSPHESWRRLRRNFLCVDALQSKNISVDSKGADFFIGALAKGFDRLVLNPPYGNQLVSASARKDWIALSGTAGPTAPVQLAFVEMIWRFTKPSSEAAAVLPLSVAANTQKAHRTFRKHLVALPGRKDFLFFDREPQALFGEDVKTRNAILFVNKGKNREVLTSSLLKWTAPQRPQIFSRSRLFSLHSMDFGSGIPRLGSDAEVAAYAHLRKSYSLMGGDNISNQSYQSLRRMHPDSQDRTLLLGPTAYNYVNCFPAKALAAVKEERFSASGLHALAFPSQESVFAAYATFSSRLCFWLWRADGDGFHLGREFLTVSPLWHPLSCPTIAGELARCGVQLWKSRRSTAVRSVNGGRVTYAFPPSFDSPIAREVEQLLLSFFSIDSGFSRELDRIVLSTVSIDGRRRSKAVEIV